MATDNPLSAGGGGSAIQTTVKMGREADCDIYSFNNTSGLKTVGLQKILENQAQLSAEIRSIDAGGVMARASDAETSAAASAVRAVEGLELRVRDLLPLRRQQLRRGVARLAPVSMCWTGVRSWNEGCLYS